MFRIGKCYKIGKSSDPSRRYREIRLDQPDPTHRVHSIETDDPSGIEAYWHNRFKDKRIRDTEFFVLDGAEVAAFKLPCTSSRRVRSPCSSLVTIPSKRVHGRW
ncbi:MAG: GIY-YIG nuclease family protein [Vulcanimicrobiaceae bacterium]